MQKLVVCIMGQNCEKFIGMCLESVKDADSIVYCDGGSEPDFVEEMLDEGKFKWCQEYDTGKPEFIAPIGKRIFIQNEYDQ